jgi:hypothetical protein
VRADLETRSVVDIGGVYASPELDGERTPCHFVPNAGDGWSLIDGGDQLRRCRSTFDADGRLLSFDGLSCEAFDAPGTTIPLALYEPTDGPQVVSRTLSDGSETYSEALVLGTGLSRRLGRPTDGLISDLRRGVSYELARDSRPVRPGEEGDMLVAFEPGDLPPILLTSPVRSGGTYSGAGLAAFVASSLTAPATAFVVRFDGAVAAMPFEMPEHVRCETDWPPADSDFHGGFAEEDESGDVWLTYVASHTSIRRVNLRTQEVREVTRLENLGDTCTIALAPDRARWYAYAHGRSQWGQDVVVSCPTQR